MSATRTAGTEAPALRILTFEAGEHLLAVPADSVEKIAPAAEALRDGMAVIDAAGLLAGAGQAVRRGCYLVLRGRGGSPPVAISAARAGEVRSIDRERLLPLPGFLFRGANPFVGLAAPERCGERATFLLAAPERLQSLMSEP